MVKNMFLNAEGNGAMTWVFVALLVVLVVVLLVVPMFTNKKRAKQTMELHNSLKPGDVIKTVGGVIGTIKEIRKISPVDTEMVIETGVGDNKTTMTFDIQALYQIMSRSSNTDPEPVPAAHDDVFDAQAKDDVKEEVVAEEKAENKVEEPVAAQEPEVAEPVQEQAVAEESVENVADKPKSTHKPVQKKSSSGTKKSTKK